MTNPSAVNRSSRRRALVAALAWAAAGSSRAQTQTPTLVLGGPEYTHGTPWGNLGARLMAELSQRSGIALPRRVLPAVRAIEMANSGELDGEAGRILDVAARYPNLEPLSTSLIMARLVAYASSPDIATRTRADILRLRIGVQRGNFLAAKTTAGLATVEAGTLEALFGLLREGRVDVIVAERLTSADYVHAHAPGGVYRWPYAWASEPLYVLINKKHAALIPRLNAAARQMQLDGTVDRFAEEALAAAHAEPLLPEPPAR